MREEESLATSSASETGAGGNKCPSSSPPVYGLRSASPAHSDVLQFRKRISTNRLWEADSWSPPHPRKVRVLTP